MPECPQRQLHAEHGLSLIHILKQFFQNLVARNILPHGGQISIVGDLVMLRVCLLYTSAKRDITNGEIIKISAVSGFKTCHGDVSLRIQLLGDASGD